MSKQVLVVDDSAMMRKIVIKGIKSCGWDVAITEASDGVEGLEKFTQGTFNLVLSDWNMPNMSGIDMVRAIREKDPEKKVPIIMVTTEGSSDKVKEAVLAGANNYLAKPFTEEKLKEKLSSILA